MTKKEFNRVKVGAVVLLCNPLPELCDRDLDGSPLYVQAGAIGIVRTRRVPDVIGGVFEFVYVDFGSGTTLRNNYNRAVVVDAKHDNVYRVAAFAEDVMRF